MSERIMPTVLELMERVNKDSPEKVWDIEALLEEFGIPYGLTEVSTKLVEYNLASHLCTDTHVGLDVVYLEDKPVYMTHQTSRKADKIYYWVNKESFNKVREHVKTLIIEEIPKFNVIGSDECLGRGYSVAYSSQLLTKQVLYKDKMADYELFKYCESTIKIDGKEVLMSDIKVPWNIT